MMGSNNDLEERFLTKINKTCRELGNPEIQRGINAYSTIPFLDIEVGTACTLNCKYCNEFMRDLRAKGKSKMLNMDMICTDMEKLLSLVDRIITVSIIGGEPFLHPELYRIIDLLETSGKVDDIRITTNATIFPSEKVLESISNSSKTRIYISDYACVKTPEKTKLIQWCKETDVKLVLYNGNYEWVDMGVMYDRHLTMEELKQTFETCYSYWCAGLYKGKIYRCGQIWVIQELLDYTPLQEEIIDVHEIESKEEMKERLYSFYHLDSLNACNYCEPTWNRKNVLAGEQW